jgi:hypothetical protein
MTAALAVRGAFALLVLATVVSRLSDDPRRAIDMRDVVAGMLAGQGLESRLSSAGPGNALASVDIEVARCSGTVKIMPLGLTIAEEAWLSEAIDLKASKRFVYVEGQWPDVDRIGLRLEWLKHRVLAAVGMSRYETALSVLLLVGPPGCNLAEITDWRMMWDKGALRRIGLSPG